MRIKRRQHIIFCSPHKKHTHIIALDDTTSTLDGTVARFNKKWGEWMIWLIEQYDACDMIYDNTNTNTNINDNYDNYTYDNDDGYIPVSPQSPHTTITTNTYTVTDITDEHEQTYDEY